MPVKTIVRWSCTAAICVSVVALSAEPADRRTYFTFNAPVAVPGATLAPGKYIFRLADTTARNVVQVLSADGKKAYSTFFAIPAERPTPPEKAELNFMEAPAGTPLPIKTWWYPQQRTGYEFVYPKEQARRLAATARQPVLTTAAETTKPEETRNGALTRISASGAEAAVNNESSPTSAMPAGDRQEGEVAPDTIVITIVP
jgi:hypothetical protein